MAPALRAVTQATPALLKAELLTAFAKLGNQSDAPREIAALERALGDPDKIGLGMVELAEN